MRKIKAEGQLQGEEKQRGCGERRSREKDVRRTKVNVL